MLCCCFFFFPPPQNNVACGGWSLSIKLVCSLLPRLFFFFLPLSSFLMMTQCVWEGWSPSCIQPSTLNTSGQSHSTQTQTTISGCRHVLHTLIKHAVLSPGLFLFYLVPYTQFIFIFLSCPPLCSLPAQQLWSSGAAAAAALPNAAINKLGRDNVIPARSEKIGF